MIGHLDGSRRRVVLAGELRGEDRGEQILGAHALEMRRHALPPVLPAQQRERAGGVPAPAGPEHRRLQRGLDQELLEPARVRASRTPPRAGSCAAGRARAAMPSSVAAACSSKSKVRQKRLRSARPQARLMRPPNGAWTTSCMPPASSKKRSATTVVAGGHRAERGFAAADVVAGEQGAARGRGRSRARARHRALRIVQAIGHALRAPRRPRRTARACAPGPRRARTGSWAARRPASSTRTPAALDPADAPGGVAEQEDVAGHGLDREVLVERADRGLVGLQHDRVVRVVRDRAARGERGEPRAAPGLEPSRSPGRGAGAPRSGPAASRCPRPACPRPARSPRGRAPRRARRGGRGRRARPRPAPRTRRSRRSAGPGRRAARCAGRARRARRGGPRARAPRTRRAGRG